MSEIQGISQKQDPRFGTNITSQFQAQNEIRLAKMVKELEEEMEKFGQDSDQEEGKSERDKPKKSQLKPIGPNK